MTYSLATGNPDEPVEEFQLMNGRNFTARTDQMQVLSSDNMRVDVRTGRIFGGGVAHVHSQFLILMKVSLNLPGELLAGIPVPEFQNINDDRSLSVAERAALPDGQLSLEDVLGSIQVACFKDPLNPSNAEPICGYRFEKMDRKIADLFLKIKLKGDLRKGYASKREVVQRASDFLKDKGYYQLPRLRNDRPGKYELEVTLDNSNPIADSMRRARGVYGMKFPFGYYPNSPSPIQFDPSFIQWKRN